MGMKSGSLLRLFQSEYFDAHLHMTYLLRMEQPGVQDYLVNELYKMEDDDVDFFLPQLCQVALLRYHTSSLHRFLLDKASRSMHFALKIYWLMQSFVEDRMPDVCDAALAMVNACETAVVNSASKASTPAVRLSHSAASSGALQEAGVDAVVRRSGSCPELQAAGATGSGPGASGSNEGAAPGETATQEAPAKRTEEGTLVGCCRSGTPPSRRPAKCSDLELAQQSSPAGSVASPTHTDALKHLAELSQAHSAEQKALMYKLQAHLPNAYLELGEPVTGWVASVVNEGTLRGEMRHFILKQRRCDYFNTQNHLVTMIVKLSTSLVGTPEKEERKLWLGATMKLINRWLFDRRAFMTLNNEGSFSLLGLHLPILRSRDTNHQILRIHVEQCRVFSSATRAPFLLVYETANLDEERETMRSDVLESDVELLPENLTEPLSGLVSQELSSCVEAVATPTAAGDNGAAAVPASPCRREPLRRALQQRLAAITSEEWLSIAAETPPMPAATPLKFAKCSRCAHAAAWRDMEDANPDTPDGAASGGVPAACASCRRIKRSELAAKTRLRIWGESWQDRTERIRSVSPFGRYSSWALNAVVVKGGDDLRQELLASQVIKTFRLIFKEAGLPLWLREAEVLVANSTSGFMECFHDTMSVNGIKKHFPNKSLADIFKVAFADCLFEAKQNFIESYAAYSLVVWFLQVKDRHNDNLLMVSTGHVVHLDFGFMLSNSPGGNIGFESSPFKLTQEFLDVMDGECSDQYEYFRTLVIRGFLEARKHVERIILPVRMLLLTGSRLPCFREGSDAVLQSLQDRFYVNLTEAACIEKVTELIDTSVNNWRTIQYDNYQRIVNGIL